MYAYFKKLNYFSTECIFAPNAYRGYARTFLKDLERLKPSSIMDIIHSGIIYIINIFFPLIIVNIFKIFKARQCVLKRI
jgi:hypothetical protein